MSEKKLSFPKNKIKVLLLEKIDTVAKSIFEKEGYEIETFDTSLNEKELSKKIKDISILGIRSKTIITKKVLQSANRLLSIGAYCIGTNLINLKECQKKGVIVFNAPYSNTRSVVEIVIAQIIILMRNIIIKSNQMHKGIWKKDSINSYEIRNKTLGIIGYGNIGSQLSVIAESLGLKVIYYDILDKLSIGNAKRYNSMKKLLKECDILSIHVDGREENTNLIGDKEINLMKKGAILINYSRGNIVNINSLKRNLKNNKLLGAAIDVFPKEPLSNKEKFKSELIGLNNIILSPHIGGSTKEAQKNIGSFVPQKIIEYINSGNSSNSINFPNLSLPEQKEAHRFIHIHKNEPGIMLKINKILSDYNINIVGQYLKTNESIGYVITDINNEYNKQVIQSLRKIHDTIKLRVLY
ncbi:MAG: phosphoglycerate dehydrogenase [Bacteroidota bacterium]|jgi:D-3-phosphoglycerate dehydrogenase|nr:phosphoglycerate dehydrogenase [Bacteroidota bacterium]